MLASRLRGDSAEDKNMIIFQLSRVPFKRRRRGPGQFPVPFDAFPSSLLPGRRRVRRGSGGSLHHLHCAKGREFFPEPIFVLARWKFRSGRIGSRSRRPSLLQLPRCKEATPRPPPNGLNDLVASSRTSRGRRNAARSPCDFHDCRTGN
jgi:hypothetical protein